MTRSGDYGHCVLACGGDPIAAVLLGAVERAVRLLEQSREVEPIRTRRRNTERGGLDLRVPDTATSGRVPTLSPSRPLVVERDVDYFDVHHAREPALARRTTAE